MAHKILSIIIVVISVFPAMAQTDSVRMAFDRIVNLEKKLDQQKNIINNLRSEVQSVTRQNLALKKSLNLQPTVAEDSASSGVIVKLMQLDADSVAKTVRLTMLINDPTDKGYNMFGVSVVKFYDENGDEYLKDLALYQEEDKFGAENLCGNHSLYPDTPVKAVLTLKNITARPQYFKRIVLRNYDRYFSFQNIPINWK